MTDTPDPDDETAHADAGDVEIWNGDWVDRHGHPAGFTRLVRDPATASTDFWLYIFIAGGVVAVRDRIDGAPEPGRRDLGMRSSGLWFQYMCEVPYSHWSLQLEAFGILVEDGRELAATDFGERMPVGLDLDFDVAFEEMRRPTRYELAGSWSGDVLVGADTLSLDGVGTWWHAWQQMPAGLDRTWTAAGGGVAYVDDADLPAGLRTEGTLVVPGASQRTPIASNEKTRGAFVERSLIRAATDGGVAYGLSELHR